jgi:hypothetical protein
MKRSFLLFLAISSLSLYTSCKSDSNVNTEDSDNVIQSDASPEEQAEAILQQKENASEELNDVTQVENIVDVELEEVVVDKEKQAAEKKKILEEQLKQSPNKGKDCDDILKEYEELVNKFLGGGGAKALKELSAWSNDPLYNTCKKDPKYKDRFTAIENKMEED